MSVRPTATRRIATVFGGSGFIGRYVVKRLAAAGHVVRVAGRDTERVKDLMVTGRVGQVIPLYVSLGNEATVQRAVEGAELVVNLVGILAERRAGDFQRVQAEGPGTDRAGGGGGGRFADGAGVGDRGGCGRATSLYARTKAAGEAAVRAALPGAVVLRPSLVFGAEDKFFNRFGAMAMTAAGDAGDRGGVAVPAGVCGRRGGCGGGGAGRGRMRWGGLYELGGPRVYTFRELLTYILHETRRHRPLWEVPMGLARLQARMG